MIVRPADLLVECALLDLELFDGRDETAVVETRERWKAYKAAGHTVVYWQQTPNGGWEKKS